MLKNLSKRLKMQYKEDKSFQQEMDELLMIHLNRVRSFFKDDEVSLVDEIGLIFNRQYAQGMLIVEMFKVANEKLELIDEAVTYIDVMNIYPSHLYNLFKDNNQDIYYVDTAHALAMDLLSLKGTRVFEIFKASCEEITNVAIANTLAQMYESLVKRDIAMNFRDLSHPMILNSQYFITPFIQKESIGSNLMQYDLFSYANPHKEISWAGRVSCHPYNAEVSTMDVYLLDTIATSEKQMLKTKFATLLETNQPVFINAYNISSVEAQIYNPE